VNIEKKPFLTEYQVEEAKVVDTLGGFLLSVKFERQGAWLLEQYSSASHGKRFAVFTQFKPDASSKTNLARWLAAPRISQRIEDGTLVFTPDATREEAENIALGLNNVARKVKKGIIW
jgi:preprotein translocase subunit SecD